MQIKEFAKGFFKMIGCLFLVTIIGAHGLGLNLLGNANVYIQDFFLYLLPIIACIVFSVHTFRKKQNDVGAGIICGFILSYGLFMLATLWGIGEGVCDEYIFNLISNC